MRFESTPQLPENMPPPEAAGHEKLVGDYAAPSQYERDAHAKEIARIEETIHGLEARLHEIAEMPLFKKLIAEKPEDGALEKLYKQLAHLKEDPRFRENGTAH